MSNSILLLFFFNEIINVKGFQETLEDYPNIWYYFSVAYPIGTQNFTDSEYLGYKASSVKEEFLTNEFLHESNKIKTKKSLL